MAIEDLFGKTVSSYTSTQATEDGILFPVEMISPSYAGPISHITTNLLNTGKYISEDEINVPNTHDLIIQADQIIRKRSLGKENFDTFYSGKIVLPSGELQTIFIEMNELNHFTVLLPEDH